MTVIPKDIQKTVDAIVDGYAAPGYRPKLRDLLYVALTDERARCAEVGAAAVMKFRGRVNRKYYPGYHEDMREAVRTSIAKAEGQS